MTKLAVVVTTPPHSNLTTTAIDYITNAIELGVDVIGVFFYQDGVLNASEHLSLPNDEYQTIAHWQALHSDHNVPLFLCITAAEKRGLSDEIESQMSQSNMLSTFTIAGLGELVELSAKTDKLVQF